ncbi:hypothetical protein Slin15195_G064230 [Septoria linicola]|uniref:Uncharacterized protein n=1 Tax=Septoria linicola TaxID=215465 RepID=A0A9Q9APJ6_9PEZI|nr:hypothetical protein Slin15195_G064230 [Septoria linicola]
MQLADSIIDLSAQAEHISSPKNSKNPTSLTEAANSRDQTRHQKHARTTAQPSITATSESKEPTREQPPQDCSYSQLPYSQLPPRTHEPDFGSPDPLPLSVEALLASLDAQTGVNSALNTVQNRAWFVENNITPYTLFTLDEDQWENSPFHGRDLALLRSCALGLKLAWISTPPQTIHAVGLADPA